MIYVKTLDSVVYRHTVVSTTQQNKVLERRLYKEKMY